MWLREAFAQTAPSPTSAARATIRARKVASTIGGSSPMRSPAARIAATYSRMSDSGRPTSRCRRSWTGPWLTPSPRSNRPSLTSWMINNLGFRTDTTQLPIAQLGCAAGGAAINRRTLSGYVALPNYRNYWKAAGYEEEMTGIEDALAAGEREKVATFMTDKWLSDCTLYGSAAEVRDGVDAWFDAGVKTPIVVMSSTKGGQFVALQELFDAYS